MSTKPRPPNGPGSNGMRGGLNTYSPKTTTGSWLEEYGGAAGYKRGFTTQDFQTEAQHAQTGARFEKIREYGAGLPLTEVVVRKPQNSDVFNPSTDKTLAATRFQSNSQLMNVNIYNKHLTDEVLLTPNLPRDKLDEYRKNWTCDTETGRLVRFKTESRLAGNCANGKFQVNSLRMLPGAPKSLEEYRARIVDRFGTFAIAALKSYVGKGDVPIQQLRASLTRMKVDLKTFEFNQIVAYITASPSTISTEDFIRTIRGKLDGFDAGAVSAIYKRLNGQVSLTAIYKAVNTSKFPEVLEGFKEFGGAYSRDERTLTENEFLDLHEDMYVSLPSKFNEIVQSIWEV